MQHGLTRATDQLLERVVQQWHLRVLIQTKQWQQ